MIPRPRIFPVFGDVGPADGAAQRERAAVGELDQRRIPARVVEVGQSRPLPRGGVEQGGVGGADAGAVVATGGEQPSVAGQDMAGAEEFGEAVRAPACRRWSRGSRAVPTACRESPRHRTAGARQCASRRRGPPPAASRRPPTTGRAGRPGRPAAPRPGPARPRRRGATRVSGCAWGAAASGGQRTSLPSGDRRSAGKFWRPAPRPVEPGCSGHRVSNHQARGVGGAALRGVDELARPGTPCPAHDHAQGLPAAHAGWLTTACTIALMSSSA